MSPSRRDERGQTTGFVVVISVALIVAAGLAVDGGRLLAARRQAHDIAAGAARAGAQAVSRRDLRDSMDAQLDPDRAAAAARGYLTRTGHRGQVRVEGDRVTVTVDLPTDMVVLGMVGVGPRTAHGTATARAARGVQEAPP